MFRSVLRNEQGDFLQEKFGTDLWDVDMYENHIEEILKKGGSISINYTGPLQRCESLEGFI